MTRIPNNESLDSDGDGMDDVYELGHPPLNPLTSKDAGQIAPSVRTYLDDYRRDESNLFLYPYLTPSLRLAVSYLLSSLLAIVITFHSSPPRDASTRHTCTTCRPAGSLRK